MKKNPFINLFCIAVVLFSSTLVGCDAIPLPFLQPSPTPTATNTPLPSPTPLPTDTPVPPPTDIPLPSDTPLPPPTQPPPTLAQPTATLTKDEAVLVFYINKDEKGPYGCNEDLWYIKTGIRKTGDVAVDVRSALNLILGYHSDTIGILYNPGYAARISINEVQYNNGEATVYLSGEWVKTKDRCDASRFKDQLRRTIKQFEGVNKIVIYLNGTPLADVLSRK